MAEIPHELRYATAYRHVFIITHVRDDLYATKREGGLFWCSDIRKACRLTFEEVCELTPLLNNFEARFYAIGERYSLEE